ncbi:DUF1836 domain-containing protein [Planococcus sp. FY231025]|uniref:DUF1836 domain-containing protein n=1 Tax=Planococcus sp. FY231025 TaxID=3455699 RepID=UPI003F923992
MMDTKQLMDSLAPGTQVRLGDIPKIDLYIDQVIQLFEEAFEETKRNEDEKILTKTMVNNYAKGKLFYPVQNKKYTRNHIMLISLIYQMKSGLSINDVKKVLEGLNEKAAERDWSLEGFYESFLEVQRGNVEIFADGLERQARSAAQEVGGMENAEELEQILLIASLIHTSNLYRRAAEKMVDELNARRESQ